MTPNAYLVAIEPPSARTVPEPAQEDVDAYYRAHVPPGGPPLAAIRQHVVDALRRERVAAPSSVVDELPALARAVDGRALFGLARDLAVLSHRERLRRPGEFVSLHGARWFPAAEGASWVDGLRRALDAGGLDDRGEPLCGPEDIHAGLRSTLDALAHLLAAAREQGRGFRFEAGKRAVPLAEQLAALEGAGIRPRTGRAFTDADLSWSDRDMEERRPFRLVMASVCDVTDDLRSFDFRCLRYRDEDADAYVHLARGLARVLRGTVVIEDVASEIDFDAGRGWLSLRANGDALRYDDIDASTQYVDPTVLRRLARDLDRRAGDRALFQLVYDPEEMGAEGLYGSATPGELRRLLAAGAPVAWLSRGEGSER